MTRTVAVTILFTDLVGSTQMLDRLGDQAGDELMRRHFDMLREAVAAHDGCVIKNLGDGLMVTFEHPASGAACAADMQRNIARHNSAFPEQPMGLRVGLNTGQAITDDGDYFGIPVVIAKRLCDQAEGGQIMVSGSVRAAIEDDSEFHDLGPVALRGLSEPIPAARMDWKVVEVVEYVETVSPTGGVDETFEVVEVLELAEVLDRPIKRTKRRY